MIAVYLTDADETESLPWQPSRRPSPTRMREAASESFSIGFDPGRPYDLREEEVRLAGSPSKVQ